MNIHKATQSYETWMRSCTAIIEAHLRLIVELNKGEASRETVLQDILTLTKLNYNTCIFGDGLPITLKFANAVGEILTAGPIKDVPPLPFSTTFESQFDMPVQRNLDLIPLLTAPRGGRGCRIIETPRYVPLMEWAIRRQEPPGEGARSGGAAPCGPRPALGRLQRLVRPQRAH